MIHKAFNKSFVAMRYYMYMGIKLEKQQAVKRYHLDRNIDSKTLALVISGIFAEQKKLLK